MDDIVEELRFHASIVIDAQPRLSRLLSGSAAEIERLRAENIGLHTKPPKRRGAGSEHT